MLVVGIGGTTSPTSSSDTALRAALDEAQRLGAEVRGFSGPFLRTLPMYDPTNPDRTPEAIELVETMRSASGIIISAAAYHGSLSGMLKNALDYTEDMVRDDRPYFAGLPVGAIAVAKGYQAAVNTLTALRMVTHSLRGWPTPYGCVINTAEPEGGSAVAGSLDAIHLVAEEVVSMARLLESGLPALADA